MIRLIELTRRNKLDELNRRNTFTESNKMIRLIGSKSTNRLTELIKGNRLTELDKTKKASWTDLEDSLRKSVYVSGLRCRMELMHRHVISVLPMEKVQKNKRSPRP
jgi:hypothetical protein